MIVCRLPSSKTSKSLRVKPLTGTPFEVTVTSTLTTRTSMLSFTCAVSVAAKRTADAARRLFMGFSLFPGTRNR